ncbi:transposase [Alicyclobacillus fastidiosus]|uniref:transposase n=1 Tax=Alicyclobacillus fastidiosus TaxID=392011 RepID=UPI0034DCECE8
MRYQIRQEVGFRNIVPSGAHGPETENQEGHSISARRKVIVEPVYGQIKSCRGFERFSVPGLSNARGEWSLVAMCHNLLKIFRYS